MKLTSCPSGIKCVTLVLFFLVLILPMATSTPQQKPSRRSTTSEPADVGMIVVLAAPEKYNGISIRTNGFLRLEFEGNALYFHEEDHRQGLTKNGLSLDLSAEQEAQFKTLNGKYVLIEGTVWASRAAIERGQWGGILKHITRLEAWDSKR